MMNFQLNIKITGEVREEWQPLLSLLQSAVCGWLGQSGCEGAAGDMREREGQHHQQHQGNLQLVISGNCALCNPTLLIVIS